MNPINTTVPVQAVVAVTDNGSLLSSNQVAVVWSSADETIATVDAATGKVTPISIGATVITASCTVALQQGPQDVVGTGTVNVTAVGDNLVASVDFSFITA